MTHMTGAALVARLVADLPALPFAAAIFDVTDDRFGLRDLNEAAAEGLGLSPGTLLPEASAGALPTALTTCRLRGERQTVSLNMNGAPCTVGLSPIADRDGHVIAVMAQWTAPEAPATPKPEPLSGVELASDDLAAPGERSVALLDLCRQAMTRATQPRPKETLIASDWEIQDFALLCQSVADELDPSASYAIAFGEGQINADPGLLRHALKQMMGRAIERAERFISVDITPLMGEVLIDIVDDGRSQIAWTATGLGGKVDALQEVLASQGGRLSIMSLGDAPGQVAQLTIPGEIKRRVLHKGGQHHSMTA